MSFLHLLGKALRRDPVMGLVVVVYTALSLVYFLPLLGPRLLEDLAWYLWEPILLTLALIAVYQGFDRREAGGGRRFWQLVSLALGFWLAGSLLTSVSHLLYPGWWLNILIDSLYLGYYLSLLLATDLEPERRLEPLDADHRIDLFAAVGLCFTLLVYFVLIPIHLDLGHLDLGETAGTRSSVLLYLGLDLLLLTRFSLLAATSRDDRWRLTYRILAAGMLLSGSLLGLELLTLLPDSPIPSSTGTRWDLLWLLPFLPFILAARLPRQMAAPVPAAPGERPETAKNGPTWGPALLYALLLPCAHLVLHYIGWLDAPSQRAREGLAILSLVIFGTLALVQHGRRELARQRAQKSLRASEQRYRQLVESCPDAILVEREGLVVYSNPAARELLGEEQLAQGVGLVGLKLPPFSPVITSPQQFPELPDPTSPPTLPIEHSLLDGQGGQPLHVEVSYLRIRYQGGLACQAILRDVTALRALREEAEGSERLAALWEFAATLAHEIRNPLASLMLNTRYLSEHVPMTEADREELAELERAIDKMQTIVTQVLELARVDQPSGAASIPTIRNPPMETTHE